MTGQKRRKKDRKFLEKIFFLGINQDDYERNFSRISRTNQRTLSIVCFLGLIGMLAIAVLSYAPLFYTYLVNFRRIFFAYAIIFAMFLIGLRMISKKGRFTTLVLCYAIMGALYFLAVLTGLNMDIDIKNFSLTFLVMMFAFPILLTEVPMRLIFVLAIYSTLFCMISYICKTKDYFMSDLINCIIYFVCSSVIVFYIQNTKFKQIALQNEIIRERDTDGLTKLMNKEAGTKKIRMAMKAPNPIPAALVVIDLDNFKSINDNFGHLFGDAVLRATGMSILTSLREEDIMVRFGGDEFVLYLPGVESTKIVDICLNRIQNNLGDNLINLPNTENLTFSAGIAFFPENGETYAMLFEKADKALYLAKRSGKDQRRYYH